MALWGRRPRLRPGRAQLRSVPQSALPPPAPRLHPSAPAGVGAPLCAAGSAAAGGREGPPPRAAGVGQDVHHGGLHPHPGLERGGVGPLPGDVQRLRAQTARPPPGAPGRRSGGEDVGLSVQRQSGESDGRRQPTEHLWVAGSGGSRPTGGAVAVPRDRTP